MQIIIGDMIARGLNGEFDVIVHGCNCFCRMGRGLADTMRQVFPEAEMADNATAAAAREKLGQFSVAYHTRRNHQLTIINAYTQYQWDGDATQSLVELSAVRKVMGSLARDYRNERIAVPLIGTGLARGNWADIERIVAEALGDCDTTIVHYAFEPQLLLKLFYEDTMLDSSTVFGLRTASGRRLIAEGNATVAHILQNEAHFGVHEMAIMHSIIKDGPTISPTIQGNVREMRDAWRSWGAQHDLC